MKSNLGHFKMNILGITLTVVTFFALQGFSGAKDGGGGSFTLASFWDQVNGQIIPKLKNLNHEKPHLLSEDQIQKLLTFMTPQKTTVTMKTEQIYVVKNEKKIPVDAANYPSDTLIELYQPSWQYMTNSGSSINHLILHEFMGLAQINDEEHLSSKVFPPRRLPISFEAQKLSCETAVKYIKLNSDNWSIRDMPKVGKVSIKMSNAIRLNKNPKCVDVDTESKTCLRYANDYWIKKADVRIPVGFDSGDKPSGAYFIDATINILSSYYGYGIWGAADRLFLRNPLMHITWKLIYVDQQKEEKVLSILTSETEETDDFSNKTTLDQDIPVPEFIETLNRNGFQLSIMPYGREITTPFHSYNIAGFLSGTAQNAGYKDVKQADNFIIKKILKGIKGDALPFRIYAGCTLDPE